MLLLIMWMRVIFYWILNAPVIKTTYICCYFSSNQYLDLKCIEMGSLATLYNDVNLPFLVYRFWYIFFWGNSLFNNMTYLKKHFNKKKSSYWLLNNHYVLLKYTLQKFYHIYLEKYIAFHYFAIKIVLLEFKKML